MSDLFDLGISHDDLNLHLWKKIHGVLASAINLRVPLLTAEAFHLSEGHSFDPCFTEGFFDVFNFEGLDDGFYFLHCVWLSLIGDLRQGKSALGALEDSPGGWRNLHNEAALP